MPAAINRKAFFDYIRPRLFSGHMTPSQVQGIDAILDTWESKYRTRTPPTQFAYVLATPYWETGRTMQPIMERGGPAYFKRMYDIQGDRPGVARVLGNTHPGDGALFPGRGLVQATGRANYDKATRKLRALGFDVDLVAHPDLAMRPDIAIALLFEGMEEGWYTGRDLDDVIDPRVDGDEHADAVRARAIINGRDKAEDIAGYFDVFLAALRAAGARD